MSSDNNPDLITTTNRMASLLADVSDDHLTGKTPCENYTVADLLDHIMGLTLAFTHAAQKIQGPLTTNTPNPSAENLDPAWRQQLPERLDALAAAWRDPAAWEGETMAGGVTMPAPVMGLAAINELVIHGWDLARATSQTYTVDEETLRLIIPLLAQDADNQEAREGMFAPVVPVPTDAPTLDRLIGLAGRNPAWPG